MSIFEAISDPGVTLKKAATTKGGEYSGPCPGCGGTDRFRVWPAARGGKGSYWCRRCGKKGDDVQFLVDFCGYEYREAFRQMGREMPDNYKPATHRPAGPPEEKAFEPRHYEDPVETWRAKANKLVESAHQAVLENEKVLGYLADRGLPLDAVKRFKLGWIAGENNKPCMFRSRESWGLHSKYRTDGKAKKLWIPRGIVIPCYKQGEIYRLRIRRPKADLVKDSDVKYYVVPGSGMEVMGHNPDRQAFVLTEAELDAMMIAHHAGTLVGTVALGSAQNKPGNGVFWHLKNAARILLALDYDEAGINAWQWWRDNFDTARFWPVPEGKDPGDAFQAGVDILEWVKSGLPPAMTMEIGMPEPREPRPAPPEVAEEKDQDELPPVEDPPEESKGITENDTLVDEDPVTIAIKASDEDLPADIRELKGLVMGCPVIINTESCTPAAVFMQGFRDEKKKARLLELLEDSDAVLDFLYLHHAARIHSGNFDAGLFRGRFGEKGIKI